MCGIGELMFNIEELKFIKGVLKDSESQDEITLNCINKIEKTLSETESYKECLWRFYWNCGRHGKVEGVFKATKEEVDAAIGCEVSFGEILGKNSEIDGIIEEGEITLESDNPLEVMAAEEFGYNPLEYISYTCEKCGCECRIYDLSNDTEHKICTDCYMENKEN